MSGRPLEAALMPELAHLDRKSFAGDEIARIKALNEARALCQRLETPWEVLARDIWLTPASVLATKIALDTGLFNKLPTEGGAKSTAQLAEATGSDPEFLRRILRMLAVQGFLTETSPGFFKGTELSHAFRGPGFIGGMEHLFTIRLPVFAKLPLFVAQSGYQDPKDPNDGPFQYGMGGNETFFQFLTNNPKLDQSFNDLMALFHEQTHLSWVNIYPCAELTKDTVPGAETPLVVDVGGGIGRDMENLRQALLPQEFPLQVQDQESVVQQGQTHPSIELKVHDFFTPQPVKGARAYFIHGVLHDFPDDQARQILAHIRSAMRVGFSTLLLCENVLPEGKIAPLATGMDLVMMGMLSAKERTETEWTRLLESAGFRMKKVWGAGQVGQPVIEAEPLAASVFPTNLQNDTK